MSNPRQGTYGLFGYLQEAKFLRYFLHVSSSLAWIDPQASYSQMMNNCQAPGPVQGPGEGPVHGRAQGLNS